MRISPSWEKMRICSSLVGQEPSLALNWKRAITSTQGGLRYEGGERKGGRKTWKTLRASARERRWGELDETARRGFRAEPSRQATASEKRERWSVMRWRSSPMLRNITHQHFIEIEIQTARWVMAKTKPGKKDLDSYTIKGTNKVVKVGDCVLMRPSDSEKPPYVARVEKIEADHRNNVRVRVRWYYRPEESIGGRRQFHGAKELFLSDHYDVQSAHTIEGKCTVHSFKNYTKLENVGAEDYFCRFEYKAATGGFTPDRVAVYIFTPNSLLLLDDDDRNNGSSD
ncbi:putative chromatin remodeling protein EBS [Cocos nucifera]|uniref:Putative chromatin remodeling protein EBS n=1 Tax=Cocos nucifera TaxID=13894 RepID=A0A8K0HUW3_COCNU|nr:putative chromatin remodeling protein EBS [Cocos nucifera]